MKKFTVLEFALLYREICDSEGSSCDGWDLSHAIADYKKDPENCWPIKWIKEHPDFLAAFYKRFSE